MRAQGRQLLLFCLIQAAWCPSLILAQASSVVHQRAERSEISVELRLATQRGFKYLLGKLQPSGNFDSEIPVAVNALVGLAFLAGGYTERSGPPSYRAALRVCTDALLKHQDASGYFSGSRMYGHGFATLYLAELYGTYSSNEKRLQDALRRAVGAIESSQCQEGGWGYHPLRGERIGPSDLSITVCQTVALRAARNLGIAVNKRVVDAARGYIQRAQNPDGGFSYRSQLVTFKRGRSAFPRSAGGVCALCSLGDYNSEAIHRGLDYLRRNHGKVNLFPYYAQFYCAQAMFQAGGSYWREYFPRIRDLLIRRQNINGGWRAGVPALHAVPLVAGDENDVQATAMALIVLQLPYRSLPILER